MIIISSPHSIEVLFFIFVISFSLFGSEALGLDYVHNTFEFVRDGKSMTVAEAMRTITSSFYTGTIKGTKAKPSNIEYSVNYLKKVRLLGGKRFVVF
jgi:hypothetical protein